MLFFLIEAGIRVSSCNSFIFFSRADFEPNSETEARFAGCEKKRRVRETDSRPLRLDAGSKDAVLKLLCAFRAYVTFSS